MEATAEAIEEVVELKVNVFEDIPQDLWLQTWPYEDSSVHEILVANVLEYIAGDERWKFMDEAYRVLHPDGKMPIAVPYWNSDRAYMDFRIKFPAFCEKSFLYFNKKWRDENTKGLEHVKCDWHFTYGYQAEAETAARNEESRSFYIKHYTNCVDALHLTLTKKEPK